MTRNRPALLLTRAVRAFRRLLLLAAFSMSLPVMAAAQGTGDLLMNTYANQSFSGTPLTTSTVTTINQTNLNPAGRGNDFSVRIEGFIFAETTGTYNFETFTDDGIRLFINSTAVIDNFTLHPPTIDTGSIDLVAGTWYPIRIDHFENGGGQRLRLRWQPPGASSFVFPPSSALSQTEPASSAPPPSLTTQDGRLLSVITTDAARALRADIATNQRANEDARERHATILRCQALREEGGPIFDDPECRDEGVSRSATPLTFDGTFAATSASSKLIGRFNGSSGLDHSGVRHIYFGDVEVSRYEGGDTSATLAARYARERMIDDRLVGYFLGLSLTQSELNDTVDGNRTGYGLSAGVYMVDTLTEALTWDGFLSVGAGRNNLDVRDGGDDITGDYNTRSILAGLALSGSKDYEAFELRPELALSYGYTDIGDVALTGGSTPIVDAGGVRLGRISFEPDFIFELNTGRSRFDTKEFWITPSLVCEYQDTTFTDEDCGGGLAIEWIGDRYDGLLEVSFRASREILGGDARDSIGFRVESAF